MIELSKDFWNCDFFRYSIDELGIYGFSEETMEFLLNYGLPKNHTIFEMKGIKFFDSINFERITFNGEEFINIGQSRGAFISIKKTTQEVFALLESREDRIFINSSIKLFLLFHQLFYTELRKVDDIDDDEQCEKFGKMMREEFEKIDSTAMLDKESTWSRLVEEYENCSI
ncbi:SUKH-4 family immunity protein [Paenibacillus hubeiensis]|uniref:SUKH-4 family immunity protein n=1 Tax=Paenibacillus hubeiensis TaxID=3077330 RepID=UPI0031BB9697